MAIILTIGGQAWPFATGTLNITETLGGRSTCEFTLVREDAASPSVGAEVIVTDGAYRVFAGTIDEVERCTLAGSAAVESRVRCTDYAHILDRRLAGEYSWSGQSAGELVRTICTQSLSDEGIGLDYVQDGPVVESFSIVYPTVAEAVTRLAEIAQFHWFVDYYRALHFFAPQSYDCPFSIGDGSRNFRSLTLRFTREEYANFVVVKLAQYVRSESETFHGDGSARTFTVGYPLAAAPEIALNGAPQTVGLAGVDTGKDWYWSAGSRDIQQDGGGTVLGPSDTLVVHYQGVDQAVVAAENAAEIAARQAIEGGSGRYEILRESGDQATRMQGEQLAEAILDRLDAIPAVAKFESDGAVEPLITAARAGQRISIGVTGYAPTASYLIRTIRIQDLPGTEYLKYEIEAVNGPLVGDAYDFFRELAGGSGSMMAIPGEGGAPTAGEAPGKITGIEVDPVDYTDPAIAEITGRATLPVPLNGFDGCEMFLVVESGDPMPLGHQPHEPGAPGPFRFALRAPRPAQDEDWTLWFVSRNPSLSAALVPDQTPHAEVSVTARPAGDPLPAPPTPLSCSLAITYPVNDQFLLHDFWTMEEDLGTAVAFAREVRYFNDELGTDPDSDWIPLGHAQGALTRSAESGPHPRRRATSQWVHLRVAALNGDNVASDWTITAAPAELEGIPGPAAPTGVVLANPIPTGETSFWLPISWTPPADVSTIGHFERAVQYFLDEGCTQPDSDIIHLGPSDSESSSDDAGPFPRVSYNTYAKARVRSVDWFSQKSDWAVAAAARLVPAIGEADPAPNVRAYPASDAATYYETVNGREEYGFGGTIQCPVDPSGLARIEAWAVNVADATEEKGPFTAAIGPFSSEEVIAWKQGTWGRPAEQAQWNIQYRCFNRAGQMTANPVTIQVTVSAAGAPVQTTMPDAPNVTPTINGGNAIAVAYVQAGDKIKYTFQGGVTVHRGDPYYQYLHSVQVWARSDKPQSERYLGNLAIPVGTGDYEIVGRFMEPQDLPVYDLETFTLEFRSRNKQGKITTPYASVTGLAVQGMPQAGGGGGASATPQAPHCQPGHVTQIGYDATSDTLTFSWAAVRPAADITNWRGVSVWCWVTGDPDPQQMTDVARAEDFILDPLAGWVYLGEPIRIHRADFPSTQQTWTFKLISHNAANQPQSVAEVKALWQSIPSNITFSLSVGPPPSQPTFELPTQPSSVVISETGRSAKQNTNETYSHILIDLTWPQGGTTADRYHIWISENGGSNYGYLGWVPGTADTTIQTLVLVGGKSFKIKVLAATQTVAPDPALAVASNTLSLGGHEKTADNVVTDAHFFGDVIKTANADGIQTWGGQVRYRNPAFGSSAHFFHSTLFVDRGKWDGYSWAAQPLSLGHEGQPRQVQESAVWGETVIANFHGWHLPDANDAYPDFRFRIFTFDRDHPFVPGQDPATNGALQTSCWDGASFIIVTPGSSTGKIKLGRVDPSTVGPQLYVDTASGQLKGNVTHQTLNNADFLHGLAGWDVSTGSPVITTTPGEVRSGRNAVKGTGYWGLQQTFTAREGDRFYIEAWVKCLANVSGSGAFAVIVEARDKNDSWISYPAVQWVYAAAAADWAKGYAFGIAPAGTAYAKVFLVSDYQKPNDIWALDDARFEIQRVESAGQTGGFTTTTLLGSIVSPGDSVTSGFSQTRSDGIVTEIRDQGFRFAAGNAMIGELFPVYGGGGEVHGQLQVGSSQHDETGYLLPDVVKCGGASYYFLAVANNDFPAALAAVVAGSKSVRMDAVSNEGLYVDDNRVVGPRASAIADLSGGATLSDCINKLNAILAMLRTHGLIAS